MVPSHLHGEIIGLSLSCSSERQILHVGSSASPRTEGFARSPMSISVSAREENVRPVMSPLFSSSMRVLGAMNSLSTILESSIPMGGASSSSCSRYLLSSR